MAFRWRADDGPTWNAGLVSIGFFRGSGPVAKESNIFVIFQGVSGPPVPPPLWIRVCYGLGDVEKVKSQ